MIVVFFEFCLARAVGLDRDCLLFAFEPLVSVLSVPLGLALVFVAAPVARIVPLFKKFSIEGAAKKLCRE